MKGFIKINRQNVGTYRLKLRIGIFVRYILGVVGGMGQHNGIAAVIYSRMPGDIPSCNKG
ncbi:hypothetical protein HNQ56_003130 [Anaerotaenia torta]